MTSRRAQRREASPQASPHPLDQRAVCSRFTLRALSEQVRVVRSLDAVIRQAQAGADQLDSAGRLAALEDLILTLYPGVLGYVSLRVARFTDAREIAEDVTQDVMTRLIVSLQSCRATTDAAVRAWAMMTTRNRLTELFTPPRGHLYRRLADLPSEVAFLANTAPSDPEDREVGTYACERLMALTYECYADAESVTASVLWHRLVIGAEWPAIARACAITPAAAKRRYQRAIEQIRVNVEQRLSGLVSPEQDELLEWLMRKGVTVLGERSVCKNAVGIPTRSRLGRPRR